MARKIYSLNPIVRGDNFTVNPEGAKVYKVANDLSLFLQMSNFKLRNSFYWNAQDTMKALENSLDENTDIVYKLAAAKFLSQVLGIRLSPVIALTRQAMAHNPKYNIYVKDVARNIMDRPDKIANALAYAEYVSGSAKDLPTYYKKALRDALREFDAYTLRKFKMANRRISLADMIKMLRPNPGKNKKLAELYKAIIENRPEAAIEKDTVITQVLSDTNKTEVEKKRWIANNISKLPLNALIRNLKNMPVTPETIVELSCKLESALDVINGMPVTRVINPFDLLEASLNCANYEIGNVLDNKLGKFVNSVDLKVDGKKVSVLVDVSGSMRSGIDTVSKYFAFIVPMLLKSNLNIYKFNTVLSRLDDKNVEVLKRFSNTPSLLYRETGKLFPISGGTALVDAIKGVYNRDKPDLMIVFSDEITWADVGQTYVDMGLKDTGLILINPEPASGTTVFANNVPVVKISSLDAKILHYIPMLSNFGHFKTWLKNWAFS